MRLIDIRIAILFFAFSIVNIESVGSQNGLNIDSLSRWDDASLVSQGGLTYNDIWGYVDENGREYAILGSRNFTHFIDVTNPQSPKEVDREVGGSNCTWRDYKVYGHYAYGVADFCSAGLEIFDLSPLPDSVRKVYDSREFVNNTHNVFIDTSSGRLYAVGFVSSVGTDIVILDLTQDPEQPELLRNLELPGSSSADYVHDVYVRNDTAYCSQGNQGTLHVYDLTDLTVPDNAIVPIASWTSSGYNHSNWLSENGKTIVLANETFGQPLRIADYSNKSAIVEVATIKSNLLAPGQTNSIAHNPFILGNDFAIISYYEDGLVIIGIEDPTDPFIVGYYDTRPEGSSYGFDGAWGVYPFLPSGNMIVSDIENGLLVLAPIFPLKDCENNVLVTGHYEDGWEIISSDSLKAEATFSPGATIDFFAPQGIELLPGFEVGIESDLNGRISDECLALRKQK